MKVIKTMSTDIIIDKVTPGNQMSPLTGCKARMRRIYLFPDSLND